VKDGLGNIRGVVGEIFPTSRGTNCFHFFGSYGLFVFWPSFFVSPKMVSAIDLLLDFCGGFVA
jgi:hypothetical protein